MQVTVAINVDKLQLCVVKQSSKSRLSCHYNDANGMPGPRLLSIDMLVLKSQDFARVTLPSLSILWYKWTF